MQQTAALRGLRPVAKALGASVGETYSRGIGWRARGGELADDPVHRRLLGLADRPGPHRAQRQLVGVPVAVSVHAEREEQGDDSPVLPAMQPPTSSRKADRPPSSSAVLSPL